jgi:ankyrin repeat protein
LKSSKVNANIKDNSGQTPLAWAAHNGHKAVVELLLESGKADVDIKDDAGWTPLRWTTKNGHDAVVGLLQQSLRHQ